MAEDLELPPAQSDASAPMEPHRRETGVYLKRFAVAYLALAVLAGIGVGTTALATGRSRKSSSGRPGGRRGPRARSTTRSRPTSLAGTRRAVIPGPPAITVGNEELAVRDVVIQNDPEGNREGFRVVPVGSSLMYRLCGSGPSCSIAQGRLSPERLQILRREALELALYTFKYGGGVDTLFTLLPPDLRDPDDPADDTAVALFFERSALKRELEQPLGRTLLAGSVPQGTEVDPREDLVIDRLTGNRLFLYQFQQSLAGGAVMFLERPTG